MDNYFWFFYIGVFLFITHLIIHGIGFDLSYFGLLLIFLAWRKIALWTWVIVLIWIFIGIEILATIFRLQEWADQFLDPSGEYRKLQEKEDQADADADADADMNEEQDKKAKKAKKAKKNTPKETT
jgi:biopolymer transport protein ExbB/TolQ